MFFNVRSVSPAKYQAWLRTARFQRPHPNSIGQLPSSVRANINGAYSGDSGNTGGGNTGNTGGVFYGD